VWAGARHCLTHVDALCSGHSDRDILIRVIVPYLVVELVFGIRFQERFGVRFGFRNLDNRFRDLLAVLGAFVYPRERRRSQERRRCRCAHWGWACGARRGRAGRTGPRVLSKDIVC
jgi:hypothetical protein